MVLAEYGKKVDTMRVVRMLLIHDIVEIDAGDVFLYDEVGQAEKAVKEDEAFSVFLAYCPMIKNSISESIGMSLKMRILLEGRVLRVRLIA